MKRPTAAGMKVLHAFDLRPDDLYEHKSMKLPYIQNRSGLRSVNIYRTIEKLEAEGFLLSQYHSDGTWWKRTKAGIAAAKSV